MNSLHIAFVIVAMGFVSDLHAAAPNVQIRRINLAYFKQHDDSLKAYLRDVGEAIDRNLKAMDFDAVELLRRHSQLIRLGIATPSGIAKDVGDKLDDKLSVAVGTYRDSVAIARRDAATEYDKAIAAAAKVGDVDATLAFRSALKLAKQIRERDNHLCQRCLKDGTLTIRCTFEAQLPVDHIMPIDMKPEWRLTPANLQTLCRPCHKLKTDEDERRTAAEWGVVIEQVAAGGGGEIVGAVSR